MSAFGWIGRLRCRGWHRRIWAEIDGTLPAAERGALRAHMAACARCSAALAAARRLDGVLASESLLDTSEEFEETLILKLAAGAPLARPASDHPVRPVRDPLRDKEDGDPMTPFDWVLVCGMIAVALAAAVTVVVLILGGSGSAAGPETAAAIGIRSVLSFAAQAPAAAVEEFSAGLLSHPLAGPLLLAAGLLAITLGWIRLFLARSAS